MDKRNSSFLLLAYLCISTLLSLSMWMLLLLPQHLAQNHWSSQKIGWAMGVFFLMYLGAQMLAGNLAQRIGNVPTALVGTGLAILGGLLYLSSLHTLNLLFVARVFHGIGAGMIQAGVIIHLIESVPPHLKGPMIGYYGLPGFVMLGAGPYLAQFLQERWELQATFYVLLLNFAATAAVLLTLPRPLVPPRRLRRFFRAMKVNFPRLKSILTFSLIFGFCISSWHSFLAPAVSHIGQIAVSSFGLGYAAGAITARLSISRTLGQHRRRLAAISGLILFALLLSVLPHLDRPWLFAAAGLLCGATHGAYYPALSSFAAERFHSLVPGHGISLYISASSLGMFLGPPFWGAFADNTDYYWMFAVAGAVLASATVVYVASEWRRHADSSPVSFQKSN